MRGAVVRRAELLRSLSRTGTARLTDLASELGVSIATVRRDVAALGRQGRLIRRHGTVELDSSPPSGTGVAGAVGMMVSKNRYLALIGQAARREAERRNLRFLLDRSRPERSPGPPRGGWSRRGASG